jgi:carboxymethylenebutenolidase
VRITLLVTGRWRSALLRTTMLSPFLVTSFDSPSRNGGSRANASDTGAASRERHLRAAARRWANSRPNNLPNTASTGALLVTGAAPLGWLTPCTVGLLGDSKPMADSITFTSGDLTLRGFIWKPEGPSPFPAILWNHGSEKLPSSGCSVATYFYSRGYVFPVPHHRGHGQSPGDDIVDQLIAATSPEQWSRLLVILQETHLRDQLAALAYLRTLPYLDQSRLLVMGASFGGIRTTLALEGEYGFRVAVNCSGAAATWSRSPDLRERLTAAASKAKNSGFLFSSRERLRLNTEPSSE